MKGEELKSQFTKEFFETFQYDAEFINIFMCLESGMSPYKVIEHLCESKKEMLVHLKKAIENAPKKVLVTTEEFENIRNKVK